MDLCKNGRARAASHTERYKTQDGANDMERIKGVIWDGQTGDCSYVKLQDSQLASCDWVFPGSNCGC